MKFLINLAIDLLYPGSLFYGKNANPFATFKMAAGRKNENYLCAMILAKAMHDSGGDLLTVDLEGVSDSGDSIGDFQIVVRRKMVN